MNPSFAPGLYKDKIALVTGGRSGIGFAIAKQLLQLGAKVTICARKEEPLAQAASALSEFGPCDHRVCDIREPEQIDALAAQISEHHGRLDLLVNNAGGQFPSLAENINDKGWDTVINNNLSGTFYMTRNMANHFFIPQQEGVIVNIIANIARGFPGMVHTGAARAGVENMSKTLAQEWARHNIRINCIAPGIIETDGLKTYPKPVQSMFEKAKLGIPMQRFGEAKDVANATMFLGSQLASYVTGITIYVDGAQHLNYNNLGLPDFLGSMGKQDRT